MLYEHFDNGERMVTSAQALSLQMTCCSCRVLQAQVATAAVKKLHLDECRASYRAASLRRATETIDRMQSCEQAR